MPRQAMDYSKCVIYKITCNDSTITECYVGHTNNFVKRKHNHKSNCKTNNLKLYQMIREHGGWQNWIMTPICEYPCENYIQACIKEEEYRVELQAKLNNNKCYIELSKDKYKKEWAEEHKEQIADKMKIYYQENKEQILEKKKEYRQENKEQILEKKKEYNQKNKEQISEKRKEKITCECGLIICKYEKPRHQKSKKHQNFIKNNLIIDNGESL